MFNLKVNSFWSWLVNLKSIYWMLIMGVLLAISFPPIPLPFLLLIGFFPLLWVIERTYLFPRQYQLTAKHLFGLTYLGFVIWNLLTCYWLMLTAFSVETTSEKIEAFIAGLLAVGLNPILMYIPIWLYYKLRKRLSRSYALVGFVAFWLCFEYLHFNWDLSWSWLTLGHAFTLFPFYIQYIEWTGTLGISFFVLTSNAIFFNFFCIYFIIISKNNSESEDKIKPLWKNNFFYWLLWLVLPILIYPLIINSNRTVFKPIGKLNVRIIQPNIDPYRKFEPSERDKQIQEFVNLLKLPAENHIELALLPESALPSAVWSNDLMTNSQIVPLYFASQETGAQILTGLVYRQVLDPNKPIPPSARNFLDDPDLFFESYNAAIIIGDSLVYKKGKMVPMVERAPFLEWSSDLSIFELKIGEYFGSFGLPDSLHGLKLRNGVVVNPIICYESEFGDYVRNLVRSGGQLNCIITNDGWFGRSSGHIQHAYLAILRSIETRRDMARCANTGMSLFINSKGEVLESLGWWKKGVLDRKLNLYDSQTFYVRYGDYLGKIALFISILLCVAIILRYKSAAKKQK